MEGDGNNKKFDEESQVGSGDAFESIGKNHHRQLQNHHHSSINNSSLLKTVKVMALFAAVFLLYHSTDSFRSSYLSFFSPSIHIEELTDLEKVLKKAAMVDGTVILTQLNEAWAAPNSIFEIFLESFKIGNQTEWLLNHLVVVALEQHAYDLCLNLHPHCYLVNNVSSNSSSEAVFMTPVYLDMMWKRLGFLGKVLNTGYSFIFTDVDIMWFRDPFTRFSKEADFQIACDDFLGDPKDIHNAPNVGFHYVKSNNKTRTFYEYWYKSKDTYPGVNEQEVLNLIKGNSYIKKIGLEIRFLDTANFGGFCQPSKDLNNVVTMHANCCIGMDSKIHDLKIMLKDWRKYMAKSHNGTSSPKSSWTVPQRCGGVRPEQ